MTAFLTLFSFGNYESRVYTLHIMCYKKNSRSVEFIVYIQNNTITMLGLLESNNVYGQSRTDTGSVCFIKS